MNIVKGGELRKSVRRRKGRGKLISDYQWSKKEGGGTNDFEIERKA